MMQRVTWKFWQAQWLMDTAASSWKRLHVPTESVSPANRLHANFSIHPQFPLYNSINDLDRKHFLGINNHLRFNDLRLCLRPSTPPSCSLNP